MNSVHLLFLPPLDGAMLTKWQIPKLIESFISKNATENKLRHCRDISNNDKNDATCLKSKVYY